MDWIEQAIFTSAETDHGSGYHVVAASPGICEADLRELGAWGPSHDALLDPAPTASSLNFHPLPSGAYCVSRTTPAGWEYSRRGGLRVYTHCLVVPPAVLARFANNPFALMKAALANGSLSVHKEVPRDMQPVSLPGRAAAVDTGLLAQLCANPGPQWMATLVQAALDSVSLAISGGPPAEQVIAGLLNCLPPECRTEFSFSTGLKFSSRRPFRLVALSSDPSEKRRAERLYNVVVLELGASPPAGFAPVESWPRLIHRVLRSGRLSFLAHRLAGASAEISPQDLPAFGLQVLEEFEATALEEERPAEDLPAENPNTHPPSAVRSPEPPGQPPPGAPCAPRSPALSGSRGHAPGRSVAHGPRRALGGPSRSGQRDWAGPARPLDLDNRAVLEKLEGLDDLVFEAISGKSQALEALKQIWPQLRSELDEPLLAESREQYLRHALAVWGQPGGPRSADAAFRLLEVLCTLFD